jgi:hypothetical protein
MLGLHYTKHWSAVVHLKWDVLADCGGFTCRIAAAALQVDMFLLCNPPSSGAAFASAETC